MPRKINEKIYIYIFEKNYNLAGLFKRIFICLKNDELKLPSILVIVGAFLDFLIDRKIKFYLLGFFKTLFGF